METPEYVQSDYPDEPFSTKWSDPEYVTKCQNKIHSISLYLETKANWNITDRTLELLAADLGGIIEGIRELEVTDVENFKLFAVRVFKKDGASLFIYYIKEARKKLAVIANDIKYKKTKTEEMMDIMQHVIPSELLKQALAQFRSSSSRRKHSR